MTLCLLIATPTYLIRVLFNPSLTLWLQPLPTVWDLLCFFLMLDDDEINYQIIIT